MPDTKASSIVLAQDDGPGKELRRLHRPQLRAQLATAWQDLERDKGPLGQCSGAEEGSGRGTKGDQ
jgi:hypothetical protein